MQIQTARFDTSARPELSASTTHFLQCAHVTQHPGGMHRGKSKHMRATAAPSVPLLAGRTLPEAIHPFRHCGCGHDVIPGWAPRITVTFHNVLAMVGKETR